MQYHGGGIQNQWLIWLNTGIFPALGGNVVHGEHVVSENGPKGQLTVQRPFLHGFSFLYSYVIHWQSSLNSTIYII